MMRLIAFLAAASTAAANDLKWPASGVVTQGTASCDHDSAGNPVWPSLGHVYSANAGHLHMGVDIDVYADGDGYSRIYAAGAGWVTRTGDANNAVIVDHGGGLRTRYLHMSIVEPANGAWIEQGALLGYEGAVGYVTGPHLHFEVQVSGVKQHMSPGWSVAAGASVSPTFTYGTTAPAMPTIVAPAPGTTLAAGAITLDWSSVAGADYHYVYVARDGAFYAEAWPVASSLTLTLPPGAYAWHVYAHNAAGYGSGATSSFTVTGGALPAAPSLYAPANAATVAAGTVALDWSSAPDADYYCLRVTRNGVLVHEDWPATSAASVALSNAGSYSWTVYAHNASGYGPGATAGFTIPSATAVPGAPAGLTPAGWSSVTGASVTLDWSDVSGATGYDVTIYYWTGSSWAYYYAYVTTGSSKTFWPQVHGTYYAWAVRAKNAAGPGAWSGWAYFHYAS